MRVFTLADVGRDGDVALSHVALCEHCMFHDGAPTMRIYKSIVPLCEEIYALDKSSMIICHWDGCAVLHPGISDDILRRMAFLRWPCTVGYYTMAENSQCTH